MLEGAAVGIPGLCPSYESSFHPGQSHASVFTVSRTEGSAQGSRDKTLLVQGLGVKAGGDEHSDGGPVECHGGRKRPPGQESRRGGSEGQRYSLGLSSGPDTQIASHGLSAFDTK